MAALLCKPCELFCTGCSKCIDEGCNCFGKVCDGTCKMCHNFCCPPNAPSPIFLTFTSLVCGIPTILAVTGLVEGASQGCDKPIVAGLIASIAVNLLLIAFAVYLFWTFSRPYTGQQGDTDAMSRGTHMFCYDPIVLGFFLVYAGAFAIAILGPVWSSQSNLCHASLSDSIIQVAGFFWVYIVGGVFVISLSWCVECGRSKRPSQLPAVGGVPHRRMQQSLAERLFFPRPPVVVHLPQPHQAHGGHAGRPNNIPVVQAVPVPQQNFNFPAPQEPPVQTHADRYDSQTGAPLGGNQPPAHVNKQQAEKYAEEPPKTDTDKLKEAAEQAAKKAMNTGGKLLGKIFK